LAEKAFGLVVWVVWRIECRPLEAKTCVRVAVGVFAFKGGKENQIPLWAFAEKISGIPHSPVHNSKARATAQRAS